MSTKIRHYFAGGNTAQGFIDYFASNLKDLEKIYILKGGPGTGKSQLMKSISTVCEEKGLNLEWIHCPSDPNSLDGIIIPQLKVAVVDGTAPHIIEPTAPEAIEEYVNLGVAWDSMKLKTHKVKILHINEQISQCYHNAYKCFADGLLVHDEWEKVYIENMDFAKADLLTAEIMNLLLGNMKTEKNSIVKHRFFGASTPVGSLDFIENLTTSIAKRYLLKGRPGTGKSTLLKKLAAVSIERGLDTEIYHCGFDSNSLDMILFPELDVCIFDSTAPHLYEPERPNDEVIDMYATCVRSGTDEKYEGRIKEISRRYKTEVQRGIQYLADAKKLHDELEQFYIEAMDFRKIDQLRDEIINELHAMAQPTSYGQYSSVSAKNGSL